ncbi:hypothetical protein [Kitasatospora sp. NPDC059817]|uniref:hypothetical protein n=1 Tax=Kitasatospora sp. NPDC059817 TaxID=3346961 RepID=UPI00364E75F6
MRKDHPLGCTCDGVFTQQYDELNELMKDELASWPERVSGKSIGSATHAAANSRTRCGWQVLEADARRSPCSSVSCIMCLRPAALSITRIDGRKTRLERGAEGTSPSTLDHWINVRVGRVATRALDARDPRAVARTLRALALNPTHRATVLDVFGES